MAFDTFELSEESGQPVELYTFTIGATVYRYTSAEDEVVFAANTYVPRQMHRSPPVQRDSDHRADMEITLPTEDAVCSRYIGIVPGERMHVTVVRFHRGDTQAYDQWSGKVASALYTKSGAMCALRCLTAETALNRTIPVFRYQSLCNHRLYDERCKVVAASYKYTGIVTAVVGRTVTVSGLLAAHTATWAVGGFATFNSNDHRVILEQTGDTLSLLLPFYGDVLENNIDVYAGCDHKKYTCEHMFSNLDNYGGFADIPVPNPFKERMI